jgi:hypothetical protein
MDLNNLSNLLLTVLCIIQLGEWIWALIKGRGQDAFQRFVLALLLMILMKLS